MGSHIFHEGWPLCLAGLVVVVGFVLEGGGGFGLLDPWWGKS